MRMDRPDLDLLRGAIDLHAHTGPALFHRLMDDAELARSALEYGMRGFVLKDHDSLTVGRAYHLNKTFESIQAFGSIVLNRSVGGLNPHVVQAAIHYGAKIIWMPTNHSDWHIRYYETSDYPQLRRPRKQLSGTGLTVLDVDGQLKREVLTILELVAEADVCLATGHLSPQETRALLDEAIRRGVRKFLVTHANWALTRYNIEEQKEFIAKGAFVEYVALSCVSPIFYEQKPSELAQWIRELGGHNLVLSSDLGQLSSPPHPEGLRMLLAALLEEGVPFDALARMMRENPAALLNLKLE